jgi:NAD(P)-dependent dehydrogenase (short-subunit alcohol dehydrogenase family)
MNHLKFNWSQQIAVVTGASRGIGAATAQLLAQRGARVALIGRSEGDLNQVAESIRSRGGTALVCRADVSQESDVARSFERIAQEFGPVSILVNNAASIDVIDFKDLTLSQWKHTLDVNLNGTFLCAQRAFAQMIASQSGGAIVNLSSLGGLRGTQKFKGFCAYSVSKFAVVGLTECLAVEGKEYGIRVNCVAPGAVNTAMLQKAAPQLKTSTTPEDIAHSIVYLCDGAEARAVTGTVLEVFSNE